MFDSMPVDLIADSTQPGFALTVGGFITKLSASTLLLAAKLSHTHTIARKRCHKPGLYPKILI